MACSIGSQQGFDIMGMPPAGLQTQVVEESRPGSDGSLFRLLGKHAAPTQIVFVGFAASAGDRQAAYAALCGLKTSATSIVHQGITYSEIQILEVGPPSSAYVRCTPGQETFAGGTTGNYAFRCEFPIVVQFAGDS